MNRSHAEALLYQALETEQGGQLVYQAALRAVQHPELKEEWTEYLAQTNKHEQRLLDVFSALDLDPYKELPARIIVRGKAEALVQAIDKAIATLTPEEAQLVAGECVIDAESKDHLNWSLLAQIVEEGPKAMAKVLRDVVDEVLEEEAEHLFHTEGWTRELWLDHLGFDAALPPPEEVKDVKTKIGAGRAQKARQQYTG